MKPFKIFLFFLTALFFIGLVSYFIQESAPLPLSLNISTPPIHLPGYLLQSSKDSSQIILTNKEPVDTLILPPQKSDTLQPELVKSIPDFPSHDLDFEASLKMREALYTFFPRLDSAKYLPGGLRILYYGDSQIEGDRITSTLRDSLQAQFGGSGPGLISPRMVVSYTKSVRVLYSKNWRRYSLRDYADSVLASNRLGIMLSLCRFTLPQKFLAKNQNREEGTIRIKPSDMGHPHAEKFSQARLFMANVTDTILLTWNPEPGAAAVDTVIPQQGLQEGVWYSPGPVKDLQIKLSSRISPDVFCLALDDDKGVAVDNIPLRGSSGTDFSKTDTPLLKEMFSRLNVQMIILHFGLNRVRSSLSSYSAYEQSLTRELRFMKKIRPGIPILVIGISDMDKKTVHGFTSYPSVEKIREAQRSAAFQSGCLFWDLYQAMGGANSMADWVSAEPPLGKEDYAHFTYPGAEKVGAMLYKSLMKEYKKFKVTKIQSD